MVDLLIRMATMTLAALLAQTTPQVPGESVKPAAPGETLAPADPARVNGRLSQASSVEQILDALERRGQNLQDFTAAVTLDEIDTALGDTTSRSGTAVYQRKGEGDARIHIVFDTRRQGRKITNQKMEYLLDNGWLIERDYDRKKEVRRQILRPGEKIDLLKLGEGPFPLPVGQPRESVENSFTVTKIAADPQNDPPGSVHVQLTPRPSTQFARKFASIDVWVDTTTEMPQRIETLDVNQTTQRRTDLKIKALNQGLTDADFQLDPTDGNWDRHDEPYSD